MGLRLLELAGALVASVLCLCACTSGDDAEPPRATGDASTTTMTIDASGPARSTTVPGSPAPLTSRAGAPLTFEVRVERDELGERGELLGAYATGTRVVVWLRRGDDASGRETSAHFGYAEVRAVDDRGVRFAVAGTVPVTLWQREQRGRFASEVPTATGDHDVVLPGIFSQRVVLADVAVVTPTATPAPEGGDPADRVLGERDLAGVAFGTPATEAVARLTARFGPPSYDDREQTECGEQRTVVWGSLVAAFRADPRGAGGGSVLAGYTYHAPRSASIGGPENLRTTNGLLPGASLATLRVIEPAAVFATEEVGYAVTVWFSSPGSRLAGRLSDDVSAPDVAVTEVSSSIGSQDRPTYPGCELVRTGR